MFNRVMGANQMIIEACKEICWQDVPLYLLDCPNNCIPIVQLNRRRNLVGNKMPIL
jgi:hypothetical protein